MKASAQTRPAPILDMHLHAFRAADQGPPPVSICVPLSIPPAENGANWGAAFGAFLKNPTCAHPIHSPLTDKELMDRTLAIMERRNVIGVASGPLVNEWRKVSGDRIIPGLFFDLGPGAPSAGEMRALFKAGRYSVLGEVIIQYQGIEPGDAKFEPYLALAEEMDIPVGIHVGPGPPGAPYLGFQGYRARLHSPLVVEEALLRHPRLRMWLMHAGWPMLDDLLAVLWTHPQLYVDVGVISFGIPRPVFHRYLRSLVETGFGNRVMFGSDQMVWPEALEVAIQSIETATFLTPAQKRDILYNNAARFLRLSREQIARHNGRK
ncbi:MAG: amidohydrolase family protein [Acidobacteriia bacterium]|nr:amidohydrolase family protein [Terriglobia bacterium]